MILQLYLLYEWFFLKVKKQNKDIIVKLKISEWEHFR